MSATTFAAVGFGLLVAHNVADHWVQTSHQAGHKGQRGHAGRMACLAHVASYTAVTAATTGLLVWLLDLQVSLVGFIAGQLVSAATHYWADRRFTLAALARLLGKAEFAALGVPRAGHDDNPSLGTGSYALDQAFHWAWLFVAALITATV